MKKLLGVSLLLLALCAALVHTLVLTPMREERRAAVSAFLQSLPGRCEAQEVAVEVLTGNVILKNVVWQGPQQDAGIHKLSANEIALKGVNIEAAQGDGPERLFRSALFSGLELVVAEAAAGTENPVREHMRLAGARLGELRGNAAQLLRWLRGELPPEERLAALLSLSLASLAVTDYSNAMDVPGLGEVMFRAKASSFQDLRLLSSGRGVWEGIAASLDGSEVLSLDLLTVEAVFLPDFLTPLVLSGDGQEEPLWLDLMAILEKDALAVRNLELTGLTLAPPGGEKLAARRLFFDLDSQENRASFKQQSDDLRLSPGFAANLLPAAAPLAQSYGKDLTINSRVELDFERSGAQWELKIKDFFFEDPILGAIKAECDLFLDGQGDQDFWDSGVACYLRHCSLHLTDKEAVAVFLRASAPDPSQMDAGRLELMRRHIAESFEIDAANADGPGAAALFRGLARISRAPGSLLVVLAPKEPLLLEPGQDLSEELNIAVEYTPAGVGK